MVFSPFTLHIAKPKKMLSYDLINKIHMIILYKKMTFLTMPPKNVVALLSLLFSNHRYCVIVAYIGVSFVLYIVSRCNPTEWITETEGMLHNQFSFPNALWFSFAALVQQGSDLSPRFDQIHFKCSIVLWLCLTITSTKK